MINKFVPDILYERIVVNGDIEIDVVKQIKTSHTQLFVFTKGWFLNTHNTKQGTDRHMETCMYNLYTLIIHV